LKISYLTAKEIPGLKFAPFCAPAYVRECNDMNTFFSPLFSPPLLSSLPRIDGFSKTTQEMRESSYTYMMDERVQLAQLSCPNNNRDLRHRDLTENY